MFRESKQYGLREPELIDLGSDFRVNLYRKTTEVDSNGVIDPKNAAKNNSTATNATNQTIELTVNERSVIEAIRENPQITQKQLHEVTGITLDTIKQLLPKLQAKGILKRIGNHRSGKWQV